MPLIIKGVGGAYHIREGGEVVLGKPRGIFRNENVIPAVGDRVDIVPSGDTDFPYQITRIYPRKNVLIRPPIANLDTLVITVSARNPYPDKKLVDKLLIVCAARNIEPILCVTKGDLSKKGAKNLADLYRSAGFYVLESEKRDDLLAYISDRFNEDKIIAFAGQSGVGKSTLCNMLLGADYMPVGNLSAKLKRGRHTTRHVELIPVKKGGYIADTPGFSSMSLFDMGIREEEVIFGYPELLAIQDCRFGDCRHMGETGCVLETADIEAGRLLRYREFVNELKNQKRY